MIQFAKHLLEEGSDFADDSFLSEEENQKNLSERHKTDMLSDNWLSKSIRPLSLLVLLSVVAFMGVMAAIGKDVDQVIFGEISILLMSAFGFYFKSRRQEKIATKKAIASIQIEKMKTKNVVKEGNRNNRMKRRRERKQERED